MNKEMLELKRKLMIQQGLDPDHTVEVPELDNDTEKERARLNVEATLRHLALPLSPRVNKRCKGCGFYFVTEYASVAYCGSLCSKAEMKRYGVDWSDKPLKHHYGGYVPPGNITPDALSAMAKVLELTGYTVIPPETASVTASEIMTDLKLEEAEPQGDYVEIKQEQIQTMNETPKQLIQEQLVEDDDEFLSFL